MGSEDRNIIDQFAIFVLVYRNEIIDIINQYNLGSLTYNDDQQTVNRVVIHNLNNMEFMSELDRLEKHVKGCDEYNYCEAVCIISIVSALITVASGTAAMVHKGRKARETREALNAAELEGRWLTREEKNQLTKYYFAEYELQFLDAQQKYLEHEKKTAEKLNQTKKETMVMFVVGGIIVVGVAAFLLK